MKIIIAIADSINHEHRLNILKNCFKHILDVIL